jgi:hypothetical protein
MGLINGGRAMKKYLGVYRATVISNVDPLQMSRTAVIVPEAGIVSPVWALPCARAAVAPTVGAGVWVQFESGNLGFPIWTDGGTRPTYGCWRWAGRSAIPVSCCRRNPKAAPWLVRVKSPIG